ncbi:four-carbon acid sugar kinase family protein [Lentibacillus salinarum]|uniref:Four-carbon acid sugar kinase family protein n=1 Tax=Lentibacillus salinarum TaxID=446820 RepID=A0ABW3ZUL5_9BACI
MKIGVVADDLTGANATGVRLSKQGFSAATVVYRDQIPDSQELDAVSIDTDTRYANQQSVVKRIRKTMQSFREWNAKVICKRIDSTIRGNIGLEIDTMLEEVEENSLAVVVASFPDSGRISSGGYLLVDGIPVQATDVAKDPVMPITQSFIPDIIQNQSEQPVGHIGLDKVLAGNSRLREAFDEQINQQNRIVVVDAVTDEEIDTIAETIAGIETVKIIPVDPGPLTAAYSRSFLNQFNDSGKMIVTVGSVTTLTGQQLRYLIDKTASNPVYVSAEKLATLTTSWEEEVQRATAEALERINENDVLIITTYQEGSGLIDFHSIAEKEKAPQDALAKRITDGLAKITRLVLERTQHSIQGCFTSGGDVTASLCAICMASGIKLMDEVLPLAAYGKMIGGHFPGLPIVTKGGMVGDKKAIFTSVKHLKTTYTKRSAQR